MDKSAFERVWKTVHLKDRLSKSEPESKVDDIRNILSQIHAARATNCIDHQSANSLFLKEADRYAEFIDSTEEQGGLNNYAGCILPMLQGKKTEASIWKSSLHTDLECIQKYMKTNKAAQATVIPPGADNDLLPFSNAQTTSSKHKITRNSDSTSQDHDNGNLLASNDWMSKSTTNVTKATGSSKSTPSSTGTSAFQFKDTGQRKVSGSLWSTREAADHMNAPSGMSDADRTFPGNQARHLPGNHDRLLPGNQDRLLPGNHEFAGVTSNQFSNKRPRDITEEESNNTGPVGPGPSGIGPSFRTARQQLAIDNQKKYGNKSKPQGSVNTASYGTNKKSLGTRRGLSSKFVPPVMTREEDDGGALVQKAASRSYGGASDAGEEMDERLKNIEPKMVELIMSEIMDQGQPLTWDDIAGLEFAKKTIQEIVVWPMLRPDIFTGLRGPPKGLLLFGPPGTGKTLIGKCIASQSKSTFFSISASSLTSKWVGEGEKMVRALFAVARVHQPAVVFIDEIDSLLSQRSETEHESSRRIKTEFLVQLDGTTTGETDRILVVGATNRPQEIDEAARRRFVKRLYIPLPERSARGQIVTNLLSQQSHHLDQDQLEALLEKSEGYSGADMANLCREAALGPIRSIPFCDIETITADQVRPITYQDFEEALKQVRASVSDKDLDLYLDWNKQYGSWGI